MRRRGSCVSDPSLQGSDALTTAKVLAAAITRLGSADLIIAATESSDGYTGTVPEQVAEVLGLPSVTFAKHVVVDGGSLKVNRQTEEGYDEVDVPAARRHQRHRRCCRAPLPELQGDHGGQVEAGRNGHCIRPRCQPGRLGRCGSEIANVTKAEAREPLARSSKTTERDTPRSLRSSRT